MPLDEYHQELNRISQALVEVYRQRLVALPAEKEKLDLEWHLLKEELHILVCRIPK